MIFKRIIQFEFPESEHQTTPKDSVPFLRNATKNLDLDTN